jgi:predicted RNA-binding Zn-ribbon protein involved in translation (DUF1610 family)
VYDVYSCDVCGEGFAVKEGKEVNWCPFCSEETVSWSHEADEL